MRRMILCVGAVMAIAAGCCPSQSTQTRAPGDANSKPMALATPTEKMSYSVGAETAGRLKSEGVDISAEAMAQGIRDVQAGGKLLMSDEEIRMGMTTFQSFVRGRQARSRLIIAQDNKAEGEAFMAANLTQKGVDILPNGLQYKIIKTGYGPKPTNGDVVKCHYRGTLIDGTEFDSSATRGNEGQPAAFKVSEVIPGWREALKMMPIGSKWQIFVPPSLAYGQRGNGSTIGPYTTLIFEIELVGIK